MLLDPTPSPPLAGGSVAELRASLPGDLSGISLEPLAESTHGGGEIVTEVSPPAASVISAPPVPSSSGSSSFRFSKTKVYGSVASLLGREKGAVDPDAVDVKKSKKKSKQSAGKGATSGSKKK